MGSFRIEFLYPMIPAIGYIDISVKVHRNTFGVLKLTRLFPLAPETMQEVILGIVDLNAVVEVICK